MMNKIGKKDTTTVPEFYSSPVPDEVFERMKGKSYKESCPVSRDQLRLIVVSHYDFNHEIKRGEMICNQLLADDLLDIFRNLFDMEYEIERMHLIDEYDADDELSMAHNNSSSFNFRKIAGTDTLSNHALGLAVDINPLYNPYVRQTEHGTVISPESGAIYADRTLEFPHKLTRSDACVREFINHGFTWGGDWESVKDYQHFEKACQSMHK